MSVCAHRFSSKRLPRIVSFGRLLRRSRTIAHEGAHEGWHMRAGTEGGRPKGATAGGTVRAKEGKTKKPLRAFACRGSRIWGGKWDSNPRQPESQSGTLPTELFPPEFEFCGLPGRDRTCDHLLRRQVLYPTELRADRPGVQLGWKLVGVKRFELPTSCSQSRRATRLRYTPGRNRILHEIRKNATGNQQAQG